VKGEDRKICEEMMDRFFPNLMKTSCSLWWLILCVNLTGLREGQIVGETLFWVVCVNMFPDEISI
jgi:hypothetical protein